LGKGVAGFTPVGNFNVIDSDRKDMVVASVFKRDISINAVFMEGGIEVNGFGDGSTCVLIEGDG
jgi:hypothetical protein